VEEILSQTSLSANIRNALQMWVPGVSFLSLSSRVGSGDGEQPLVEKFEWGRHREREEVAQVLLAETHFALTPHVKSLDGVGLRVDRSV